MSENANGAVALMRRLRVGRPTSSAVFSVAELSVLRALRDEYGAAAESADGWRLAYEPEWFSAQRLRADIAAPLAVTEETTSTNLNARANRPPFFVFAEHQFAGRGRRGRRWLGLPGDALMMSAALPAPPFLGGLSVAVGAVLWRSLAGDKRMRLKWPNDLLDARGAKVGGVLVEVVGDKAIVGIGLNRTLTPTFAARAAVGGRAVGALNDVLSPTLSRHECAVTVARAVVTAVATFAASGFDAFRDLATAALAVADGEWLRLRGGELARFAGFDENGALLTTIGDGVRCHFDGEYVVGG